MYLLKYVAWQIKETQLKLTSAEKSEHSRIVDFIYLKSQVLAEPIAQTILQETGCSVSPLHVFYVFYSQIVLERTV